MKIDFGALLAMTHANGPSVIQIRTQDVLPEAIAELLLRVLTDHGAALQDGAIVSVDQRLSRVRVLPVIP
jgi:predicted nuclease of predicted toxin-antitoxin system